MSRKRMVAGDKHPALARRACGPALTAALAGTWVLSGATWAADQGGATDNTARAQPASDLAEVIVSAEKRDSTVQKTPISMTAISGADLQAQGVNSLTEVAQQVPGVS
ncbi:MAG TPA: TonB-dependent receptor plug domain-containing protein, partial [Steroidobacteraceae bacterium]